MQACDDRVVQVGAARDDLVRLREPDAVEQPARARRGRALRAASRRSPTSSSSPETAIFNLHVPPYDSGLDTANEINPDLTLRYVGGQPQPDPGRLDRRAPDHRGVPAAARAARPHPRVARGGADRPDARDQLRVRVQQRPHPRGRWSRSRPDAVLQHQFVDRLDRHDGGSSMSDDVREQRGRRRSERVRALRPQRRPASSAASPPRSSLIINFIPGHPTQTHGGGPALRPRRRRGRQPLPRAAARRPDEPRRSSYAFGLLTQMIPRSGGDYMLVSRVIHPAVGYVSVFCMTTAGLLSNAFFGLAVVTAGLVTAVRSRSASSATGRGSSSGAQDIADEQGLADLLRPRHVRLRRR